MKNEVYILKLDENFKRYRFNKLVTYVDEKQRERILRIRDYGDALRSLIANILIRNIIIRKLRLNNSDICFGTNKYGKPYLLNNKDFCFNLSHSGVWVACAVSDKSIGIDVEEIKSIETSIANRFFSVKEVRDLFSFKGKDRLLYFYDLWTLKESYIKAKGKGLSIPLNSFTLRRDLVGNFYLEKGDEGFLFQQFETCKGYKLSTCVTNGNCIKNIEVSNLDKLYSDFLGDIY
ncbi:4'-phosphopantetheinyl transferase family protein [Wukongibacter sp. M2B1]|uniref:4'-phosphopantetheinyl transferase family protein n=1 Tax=Wukongibacter sp. M2B1 TaxID=3088895 RepID=UPI003D7953B1